MTDTPNEDKKRLFPKVDIVTPQLIDAVEQWADDRTRADSKRRHDLLRDKYNALLGDGKDGTAAGFFVCIGEQPQDVTPEDVQRWQDYLKEVELSHASIYARVSRLASFYDWLAKHAERYPDWQTDANPAKLARPKAPKAYQSKKSKSLSDEDARTLLHHVREEAGKDNISAKRDYALLRFYFATGMRRSEIIDLRWHNLEFEKHRMIIHLENADGSYRTVYVTDGGVKNALFAYLRASERWDGLRNAPDMRDSDPLWLRHDRAAKGQQPVTSHGFVYMLKKYAKACGIGSIHVHQMRHTVARIARETGDINTVQALLGHQNIATTRAYVERVAGDSEEDDANISERLGLDELDDIDIDENS